MTVSPKSSRTYRSLVGKISVLIGAIALSLAVAPIVSAQESPAAQAAGSRALVNSARSAAGLKPLHAHSGLDTIAQAQAERMVERDAIYHNPNLKADADAAGVNWRWIGENVGVGAGVQAVHDGFMASPGHHQNIVYRDYDAIGVGVAVGRDGSIFVAHAYAGLMPAAAPVASPASTPDPAPQVEAATSEEPPVAPAPPPTRPETVETAPPSVNAIVGGVVSKVIVF